MRVRVAIGRSINKARWSKNPPEADKKVDPSLGAPLDLFRKRRRRPRQHGRPLRRPSIPSHPRRHQPPRRPRRRRRKSPQRRHGHLHRYVMNDKSHLSLFPLSDTPPPHPAYTYASKLTDRHISHTQQKDPNSPQRPNPTSTALWARTPQSPSSTCPPSPNANSSAKPKSPMA